MKSERLPSIKGYMDFTSPENPGALPMEFTVGKNNRGVQSSFSIPKTMSGWRAPEFVAAHPGAVDTAMTTAMGRAVIFATKQASRVKSLNVEYLGLVPIETTVLCEARVIGQRGTKEAVVEARIKDAQGTMLAKGTAVFDLFDIDVIADARLAGDRYAACAPAFVRDMVAVINRA